MICAFCGEDFGEDTGSFGRLVNHQRNKHMHYNSGYAKLLQIHGSTKNTSK